MELRERVIEKLEEAMMLSEASNECKVTLGYGVVEDILALLKAQEPVRPIIEKNISTGECEDPWGRLFFCGACGKMINEKYNPDEDDKYCKHCGQAVKWE